MYHLNMLLYGGFAFMLLLDCTKSASLQLTLRFNDNLRTVHTSLIDDTANARNL